MSRHVRILGRSAPLIPLLLASLLAVGVVGVSAFYVSVPTSLKISGQWLFSLYEPDGTTELTSITCGTLYRGARSGAHIRDSPREGGDYHLVQDIVSSLIQDGRYEDVYETLKERGMDLD